jgi:1-acyl-sn-glycerol-3-phosphate acyltransferase
MTGLLPRRVRFLEAGIPLVVAERSVVPSTARRHGLGGRILRQGYEYVAFYGLLTLFAISSLVFGLVAAVLALLLPRRQGQPVGQFLIMAGCRYFVGLMKSSGIITCDLAALDPLAGQTRLVIAANHPTLLDVILIVSRLPRVVCTAKAGLLNNFFVGASARLAGYIRNDAATPLVREGIRQLAHGRQLLIFPEGTRSSDGTVGPFKPGFALMAQCAVAPIQTVFIETNSRFLGKGWPLWRKPAFPLSYRVRLGPVLDVGGDVRTFVAELRGFYQHELGDKFP